MSKNSMWWHRVVLLLFAINYHLFTFPQVGTWRSYMSYYEPQQICKAEHYLFVKASNNLYQYNLDDESITTYYKTTGLSDNSISLIAWNNDAKQLIIVYQNSNIDLMDTSGNVFNISALYSKSMTQDKTVNSIYIYGSYAYLSTGFGIVKVDMKRKEIAESYMLNLNTTATNISNGLIYAKTSNGVYSALLSDNLINTNNWVLNNNAPSNLFLQDNTDWNNYLQLVATLNPGGPKSNYFGFMRFKHNRLYSCSGGYAAAYELRRPGRVQILNDGEWTFLQDDLTEQIDWNYEDVLTVDADNSDPDHVFVGGKSGLFEFNNGSLLQAYNIDNSPLATATTQNQKNYVLVKGISYDTSGTLWVLNSNNYEYESIFEFTPEHQWISHKKDELKAGNKSIKAMLSPIFDRNGFLWFVNSHWEVPSFYCYDPKTDKIIHNVKEITNQDGTVTSTYQPNCVAEDLEGNIWIGTSQGPFVVEASSIGTSTLSVIQVKVPRNDGSDYADYLLAGVNISCMIIDGGGRKWFGTPENGIYLISADNMTQLAHFTIENSPLASNNIESMAINSQTGELFIGTDAGLCSYMTDSTEPTDDMSTDNVYAYPNPVTPDYTGLITIVGLSLNADVKIMTSSGKLIAEGRSNGGTFTWDGCDRSGRRVASGVYMVAVATQNGKKGTVCKIAVVN